MEPFRRTDGCPSRLLRLVGGTLSLLLILVSGPVTTAWAQSSPVMDDAAKRARINALREMLNGNPCARREGAEALLAAGETAMAAGVGGARASGSSGLDMAAATPPPPPPAGSPASSEPSTKPMQNAALVDKLRQAVVLIIAGNDSGSGFFITPNLILTNQHVVAKATKGEVVVVGRGLDRPRMARITAMTRSGRANQRDFALLEVQGGTGAATLAFASNATALDNVVAAGFPGLLLANDGAFKALAAGDLTAMPELAFTKGQIMARQNAGQGVVTLAHSAAISGGNSGGPLVDSCGNVVGVNSFINVAVSQGTNAGFAQSADDAMAFLAAHGAKFRRVAATCQAN